MRSGEEAAGIVMDLLNERGIAYLLVGSFSSNYYGVGRATKDADFVLELDPEAREAFFEGLPDGFEVDPQIVFETITGNTRQMVRVPSVPFAIEFFELSDDVFAQERFARRVKVRMGKRDCWLPTAEDVILQKLRWFNQAREQRAQDFQDVRDVIAVQGAARLDWNYLHEWGERLDLAAVLGEVRASLGEGA